MKRIILIILVLSVVFSVSAVFADQHLFAHFSLFIDSEFYNTFFKAGFKNDTEMYDFYLYDDFSGGLFCKEEWYMGQRINYGLHEVKYTNTGSDSFKLTFDDGSFFSGFWDKENDEDIWISFNGKTYFRFVPVHSFDIQKDMVDK